MRHLILNPSGKNETKIALQTRMGADIDNGQCWHLTMLDTNGAKDLEKKYASEAFRSTPCPIYNCHGLTFASRRTWISDVSAIRAILDDDNYMEIARGDVMPGDVILYFEDGDISHSGIVVATGDFGVPIVWSKWGRAQEVVHRASACPYAFAGAKFYRMKPWKNLAS